MALLARDGWVGLFFWSRRLAAGFEFRFGSTGGKDFVLYINQTSRHLCRKD
nr:MAG TPA: hypothetical protein [Siphoviridae sp. ctqkP4]